MTVAMATFRYHGYRRPSQIAGAFSSASRREAMAHIIKSIVNELSKTPFNFNLTVVGLNSLQPAQLLQILSDVVCEVESKERINITEEPLEKSTLRLLTSLQILKFKPETENPNTFQEGLMQGQSDVIHPILHWLLQRRVELKKRAYLARFLLKIDIPPEMNSDSDVVDLYEQYEQLIGEFKQVHRLWDASQTVTDTVSDLRKDMATMEDDREVLIRRIERNQRKMEHVANYHQLLSMAKKLRTEKEKQRQLQQLKDEQKNLSVQLEGRRQRLHQQLFQMNDNANATNVVQRMEDAIRVHRYMLKEKLPKEIQHKIDHIALMEKLLQSPNPTPTELQLIIHKNEDLQSEIAALTEKRALKKDPTEDGVALYRQQSLIVARKKESSAEELNQLRQELHALEIQLEKKKEEGSLTGESAISAEQFKSYVSDLRVKSNIYKQNRIELNDLKSEYGILSRTLEILTSQESSLAQTMSKLEIEQGVRGFRETREELEKISDEKATTDDQKSHTLEEMSNLVRVLNSRIAEKKNLLAPLLRELRPLRLTYQESLPDYESKKGEYDAQIQLIDNSITSITDANGNLENETALLEKRQHQLKALIDEGRRHALRAAQEMKLYVSGDKSNSAREQLQQSIAQCEKTNAALKREYDLLQQDIPLLQHQIQNWTVIEKIFQAKQMCLERQKRQEGTVRREKGRETLVLH